MVGIFKENKQNQKILNHQIVRIEIKIVACRMIHKLIYSEVTGGSDAICREGATTCRRGIIRQKIRASVRLHQRYRSLKFLYQSVAIVNHVCI